MKYKGIENEIKELNDYLSNIEKRKKRLYVVYPNFQDGDITIRFTGKDWELIHQIIVNNTKKERNKLLKLLSI